MLINLKYFFFEKKPLPYLDNDTSLSELNKSGYIISVSSLLLRLALFKVTVHSYF